VCVWTYFLQQQAQATEMSTRRVTRKPCTRIISQLEPPPPWPCNTSTLWQKLHQATSRGLCLTLYVCTRQFFPGFFTANGLECKREVSIEWYIENQAFSRSYDLAPPLSPPLPSVCFDRRHTGRLRKRNNLLTVEGMEAEEEPNHTPARKPGPL
jgi:hypothetical protein